MKHEIINSKLQVRLASPKGMVSLRELQSQTQEELDAYYARLYGLTRDELRYTPYGVDPKEVHGEDFPGETFRVLKEKEVRQFGDASRRTRCLVLEAWDRLQG